MAQNFRQQQLADLERIFKDIVIGIGTTCKNANLGNDNAISKFQQKVPGLEVEFHEVLDDLECEIIRAKAVLLRDLEIKRTDLIARADTTQKYDKDNQQIIEDPSTNITLLWELPPICENEGNESSSTASQLPLAKGPNSEGGDLGLNIDYLDLEQLEDLLLQDLPIESEDEAELTNIISDP